MLDIRRVVLYFTTVSVFRNCREVDCLKGNSVDAAPDEFPFVVFLGPVGKLNTLNLLHSTCTGVFITKEHVLALADCIKDTNEQLGVYGGSHNVYETRMYDVSTWMTYNDWATLHGKPLVEEYQDIAIITISNPDQNRSIRPAYLPGMNDEFYGTKVAVVGMGETDDIKFPSTLKTASLTLLTKQRCKARVPSDMTMEVENGRLICSEPPPELVTEDRGGPLLYAKNTLVGINLVLKKASAWANLPAKNVHLKIHSYPLYRKFICELVGDGLVSRNPEKTSKSTNSFCDE